ncbi:MAG TPA: PAS domain-containing protein, partial [Opitutaceae bacterium]
MSLAERKSGRARAVAGGALLAVALIGLIEWWAGQSLAGRFLSAAPVGAPVLMLLLALVGVMLWWNVARLHRRWHQEDAGILEEAGAEAKAAEARFRAALFDSPMPALLWTDRGAILMVSRRWIELTGYAQEDVRDIGDWTRLAFGRPPPENLPAF